MDLTRKQKQALFVLCATGLVYLLIPRPELFSGQYSSGDYTGKITFSKALYDANGKLLRLTLSDDDKYRLRLPLREMSPTMVKATLLHEDRYFYYHPGFNPFSLIKAFFKTYVTRSKRMGASTITMQLARMRYGIDSRTILGKFGQILKAIQLERHYSKDEILEAYLNLVPYGGNIEGVGAASLIYFQKNADRLTLHDSLTLSVIPQSPAVRFPDLKEEEIENHLLYKARIGLLAKWLHKYPHDKRNEKELLKMEIPTTGYGDLPFLSPHFTDYMIQNFTGIYTMDTTLDLKHQEVLERQIKNYLTTERIKGIENGAALLIDYTTMELKAMVGSADFFNEHIDGQVNGTIAKRSPGSTLKPFIYSLAMDESLIHPLSMLKDSPVSFGEFNPENFDNDFDGPIKAKDALLRSRNVPAVTLAKELKELNLYGLLKEAGVSKLKSEDYYGLAVVLGGTEVTMFELAELYAMLAGGGIKRDIRVLKEQKLTPGKNLISPEASYLTLEILEEAPRYDSALVNKFSSSPLTLSFKTGTSWAFRDAWSAGVFGQYVLVVWLGNFSGEPNPSLVGFTAAAPLFTKIAGALDSEGLVDRNAVRDKGSIKKVQVCSLSGKLPGPFCKTKTLTSFIPGTSPIHSCDIHREVAIDKKTNLRLCPGDDTKNAKKVVYEFWPSDLLDIFKRAGIPRRVPPKYKKECELKYAFADRHPPEITSPKKNISYTIRVSSKEPQTIPFTATTDGDTSFVHWFADETYLGKVKRGETFFWKAQQGESVIRAIDDMGRSDARTIKVEVVE